MLLLLSHALAAPPTATLSVVPAATRVPPGKPVEIAVKLALPAGWHVYWENPGASGLATDATVTVAGARVEGPRWPAPERFDENGQVTYGYAGEAALLFTVVPVGPGPLPVSVRASWLLCREACVRGEGQAAVTLTVDAAAPPAGPGPLASWLDRVPRPFPGDSGGSVSVKDGQLSLRLPGPGPIQWFPSTALEAVWKPDTFPSADEGILLTSPLASVPPDARLIVTRGTGASRRAWTVSLPH